ncbi:MAG: conjugal transfer protein TraX [Comamonadaceae bacterium]|nr:conjugal transfer protein TraX [Comamonadaceae bacterium]
MTIDHVGAFLVADDTARLICRIIGRIAYPLFALMIAEGYPPHARRQGLFPSRFSSARRSRKRSWPSIWFAFGINFFLQANVFLPLVFGLIALMLVATRKWYGYVADPPDPRLRRVGPYVLRGVRHPPDRPRSASIGSLPLRTIGLRPPVGGLHRLADPRTHRDRQRQLRSTSSRNGTSGSRSSRSIPIGLYDGTRGRFNKWFFYRLLSAASHRDRPDRHDPLNEGRRKEHLWTGSSTTAKRGITKSRSATNGPSRSRTRPSRRRARGRRRSCSRRPNRCRDDWFPDLAGKNVLCLASGGGRQGPLFAALGALVTRLRQLAGAALRAIAEVAAREHLSIRTRTRRHARSLAVSGRIASTTSSTRSPTCSAPTCCRSGAKRPASSKTGGRLAAGFMNPAAYIFDLDLLDCDRRLLGPLQRSPTPTSNSFLQRN